MKRLCAVLLILLLIISITGAESEFPSIAVEFFVTYDVLISFYSPDDKQKEPEVILTDGDILMISFGAGRIGVNTKTNKIEELHLLMLVSGLEEDAKPLMRALCATGAAESAAKSSKTGFSEVSATINAIKEITIDQDLRIIKGDEVKFYETENFDYFMWNSEKTYKDLGLDLTPYTNIILKAK